MADRTLPSSFSIKSIGAVCFVLLAALLLVRRDVNEDHKDDDVIDLESFIQIHSVQHKRKAPSMQFETCLDLNNKGSHFEVDIGVGTPAQPFSVVADTGSNHFWVASCACKSYGHCLGGRCYTGTNKSSTFHIQDGSKGPPVIRITYGSGPVTLAIASDLVKVGSISVTMNESLYLAIDNGLQISAMEGILGLGIPQKDLPISQQPPPPQQSYPSPNQGSYPIPFGSPTSRGRSAVPLSPDTIKKIMEKVIRHIIGSGRGVYGIEVNSGHDIDTGVHSGVESFIQNATGDLRMLLDLNRSLAVAENTTNTTLLKAPRSFLENAGIDTFSMCFRDGNSKGSLRLGTPKKSPALESFGVLHWGLGLNGISVGNKSATSLICSKMQYPNQSSPCGAIPDSGTTLITVPDQTQLLTLLVQICDGWERCANEVKKVAGKYGSTDPVKAKVLTELMKTCDTWIPQGKGLKEIPSLYFHLSGKNGINQTLELTPWAYIMETTYSQRTLQGFFENPQDEGLSELQEDLANTKVCSLSFSVMPYNTQTNGPVWILGTAFFYQFNVGYDIKDLTVSFTSIDHEPCSPCSTGLTQTSASEMTPARQQGQLLRSLKVSPRSSSIDTNLPF